MDVVWERDVIPESENAWGLGERQECLGILFWK